MRAIRWTLAAGLWLLSQPTPSAASDFWNQVRTPGLSGFRRALSEAQVAMARGDAAAALEGADRALSRLPGQAQGHVLRGLALAKLERFTEAAAAFQEALALDEAALDRDSARGAIGQAAALAATHAGDLPLASRVLERLSTRLPAGTLRGGLYALRGDVLLSMGPDTLRDAELSYRQALRDDPRSGARAKLGLALCLTRAAATDQALALLRTLQTTEPIERVVARLPVPASERAARRALFLGATGDSAGSWQAWQSALDPDSPWHDHTRRQLESRGSGRAAP